MPRAVLGTGIQPLPRKRSFGSAWEINTQRECKHDMDSNRRRQSTEKATVFGVHLLEEKILEWNAEGQMLITHRKHRVKGHYTEGKE